MIPQRFSIDYPARVWALYEKSAARARADGMEVSLLLTTAMPLVIIPLERRRTGGSVSRPHAEGGWHEELQAKLERTVGESGFVSQALSPGWRHGSIQASSSLNRVDAWIDEDGLHPLRRADAHGVEQMPFRHFLEALRNGMAHGNVVYLSEQFGEDPQQPVRHLAFVSRGNQGNGGPRQVVCVETAAFEAFLRAWAAWLARFELPAKLSLVA